MFVCLLIMPHPPHFSIDPIWIHPSWAKDVFGGKTSFHSLILQLFCLHRKYPVKCILFSMERSSNGEWRLNMHCEMCNRYWRLRVLRCKRASFLSIISWVLLCKTSSLGSISFSFTFRNFYSTSTLLFYCQNVWGEKYKIFHNKLMCSRFHVHRQFLLFFFALLQNSQTHIYPLFNNIISHNRQYYHHYIK